MNFFECGRDRKITIEIKINRISTKIKKVKIKGTKMKPSRIEPIIGDW